MAAIAPNLNETLMGAIARHDVQAVQACLDAGADPSYTRYADADEHDGILQPTTPLRMVVFCISDALLNAQALEQFAQIARLLLQHGADPKPAQQLALHRYGKYAPTVEENAFTQVWQMVAEAG